MAVTKRTKRYESGDYLAVVSVAAGGGTYWRAPFLASAVTKAVEQFKKDWKRFIPKDRLSVPVMIWKVPTGTTDLVVGDDGVQAADPNEPQPELLFVVDHPLK